MNPLSSDEAGAEDESASYDFSGIVDAIVAVFYLYLLIDDDADAGVDAGPLTVTKDELTM